MEKVHFLESHTLYTNIKGVIKMLSHRLRQFQVEQSAAQICNVFWMYDELDSTL